MKEKVLSALCGLMLVSCVPATMPRPDADPVNVPREEQIMCTQDAKQCPDGRWVGRSGPRCEFICR